MKTTFACGATLRTGNRKTFLFLSNNETSKELLWAIFAIIRMKNYAHHSYVYSYT